MKNENSSQPSSRKPTPPKKPVEPVVRRIVNEKVINSHEIPLGRR